MLELGEMISALVYTPIPNLLIVYQVKHNDSKVGFRFTKAMISRLNLSGLNHWVGVSDG